MKVMKSMKKLKAVTMAAVVLGLGANLMAPREANAGIGLLISPVLAITGIAFPVVADFTGIDPYSGWSVFVGAIIFDQKIESVGPLTKQDLLDNGYSGAQVEVILSDANRLNEKLKAEKKVFALGDHETLTSIRDGLKAVSPDASEEFLDVASQRLFLVVQSRQNRKDARVTDSAVKPNSEIPASSSSSAETGSEAAAAK